MRLSIAMMQKNEGNLLGAWIAYHLRLVDPSDLVVIDNGSTDSQTLSCLFDAERKGVTVLREYDKSEHFEEKGQLISDILREKQEDGADFAIPLDCDEFLAYAASVADVRIDPATLREKLQELPDTPGYFMMKGSYFNKNSDQLKFDFGPEEAVFFGRSLVKSMDIGFHSCVLKNKDESFLYTNFVTIHLQNKRIEIGKVNAAEKLKSRVPDFSFETLKSYRQKGAHLKRWFFSEFAWDVEKGGSKLPEFDNFIDSSGVDFPYEIFLQTDRYRALRSAPEVSDISHLAPLDGLSTQEAYCAYRNLAECRLVRFAAPSILAAKLHAQVTSDVSVASLVSPARRDLIFQEVHQNGDFLPDNWIDVSLGVKTNDFGLPEEPAPSENVRTYISAILRKPDLDHVVGPIGVVNNGRYRLAVAAAAALKFRSHGCIIVFQTFWSRAHYHAALQFTDCVDVEGDIAILRPNFALTDGQLTDIVEGHLDDPR